MGWAFTGILENVGKMVCQISDVAANVDLDF
jgi:hypothetical protein